MDRASYYRDRANHARQLAAAAWQPDLADALRRLAQDYDEIAEDLEAGATRSATPNCSARVTAESEARGQATPARLDLLLV
jgi:hypothetical protein